MYKVRIAALAFLCLGCASCESAFGVRGKIVAADSDNPRDCYLELHRNDGDRLIERVRVSREMRASFTIAATPWRRDYYMLVTCEGIPSKYRSNLFRLPDLKYAEHPIDLGTIVLDAPSPPPVKETNP